MKNLLIALLSILLLLTACGPTRKSTSNTSDRKEETTKGDTALAKQVTSSNLFKQTKDSTVGVAGRQLTQTLTQEDLQPAYTKEGKAVTRTHVRDSAGVTNTVTIKPDGTVQFKCKTDSLTMVIKSLDSTVTILNDSNSYLRWQNNQHYITKTSTKEEVKVYGLEYYLKWAGVALLIIGVAGWLIKRFA